MVCPVPPKTTVPDPDVNRDPVPPQAVAVEELTFKVAEPPFKEPPVRVTFPEKVWVPEPRFSVPVPDPLMVKAPPETLPAKVAVPALFDKVTAPVVVNPAID